MQIHLLFRDYNESKLLLFNSVELLLEFLTGIPDNNIFRVGEF